MADEADNTNQGEDSHLAAAEKFFADAEANANPTTPPAAAAKPAATASVVTKELSVADKLFKLPGAKETAPPAAEPVVDDLDKKLADLKEPSNEKSRADWGTLKALVKEQREARVKVEQELQAERAAKSKLVDPAAIEASKARITELETLVQDYSTKLKAQDIRQHPDYVKEVEVPKANIQASMKTLLDVEGVEADLGKLLSATGKEFSKIVSDIGASMSDFGKTQFYSQVQALREIQLKGESIVKSSEEFKAAAKQKALAEDRRIFQSVQRQFLSEEFVKPQVADEKASDEEKAAVSAFNAARQQVAQVAEQIAFGEASIQNVANTAHEAAMFKFLMNHGIPRMGQMFDQQLAAKDAELTALRARVASLEKAGSIELGGGGGTGGAEGGATRPEDMDHKAAARHYFGR